MIKNDQSNISSQCQVVFFNWKHPVADENLSDAELSASTLIDVSKYIQDVEFSKNLAEPTGAFSIKLPNDRDWKEVLQEGSWGIVYMSQDRHLAIPKKDDVPSLTRLQLQTDKVRGIIYIDRIAAVGEVGDDRGEYDVEFVVSGRDFGVVYVENEIFYNRLLYEGKLQEAAAGNLRISGTRSTDDLLTTLHRLFFAPELLGVTGLGNDGNLQKDIPRQWLLPSDLFVALNIPLRRKPMPSGSYWGAMEEETLLNFDKTKCSFPVDNPMTQINGKAWDRLKSFSIEQFHELFTETNDEGQPQLNFRYIPWKTSSGAALGDVGPFVMNMATDVPQVAVDSIDILSFDVGQENHNRYNYFFTTIDGSLHTANDTMANLRDISPKTGFPRVLANSIKRNGLRMMYVTVNALFQFGTEKADPDLLRQHNELILEYWKPAHEMESGTVTIIGNNAVKVGKVLKVAPNVPYNGGKVFYIESYTDHFVSDQNGAGFWTQTLMVTRGFFPGKIGQRGEPYSDNGEFTET